ncbi:MAG TPA: RES family NAD+ phosphorylase [Cytophagales bacterium]|nr:RES family NAD+ phosphorylase [Cytophagales bacterium]
MLVYRISQTKHAGSLTASGIDARWNSLGQKVIYTAGSIALACLENLAHRSGTSLSSGNFSIAIIDIENTIKLSEITVQELKSFHPEWHKIESYSITQELGDKWLLNQDSAVLKVPSSIIDLEFNYLINPYHSDFGRIKIINVSKFTFDPRLKATL